MMARGVMAIRIDPRTRTRLQAASRRQGRTPSAIARLALDAWLEAEERQAAAIPYAAIAELIGCVKGGDPERSTRGVGEPPRPPARRRRRR
jgi:predicted transcriptional regulator